MELLFIFHDLVVELTEICLSLSLNLVLPKGVVGKYRCVLLMVLIDFIDIDKKIDRLLFGSGMLRRRVASLVGEDWTRFK